jgi:hypothetical protein
MSEFLQKNLNSRKFSPNTKHADTGQTAGIPLLPFAV